MHYTLASRIQVPMHVVVEDAPPHVTRPGKESMPSTPTHRKTRRNQRGSAGENK